MGPDHTSPATVIDPAETEFFSDLQVLLADQRRAAPKPIRRICGADAAYRGDRVFAAASLLESGRRVVASYEGRCTFPYSSGLFYLREGPFVVAAVRSLGVRPHLVCFDAHGAAHPRSVGLATVCGMVLGIPSIGVAKSLLVGEVSPARGLDRIVLGPKTVGFVTAWEGTRRYWSPGFSVTLSLLRSIIAAQGRDCLRALEEADRASKRARSSSRAP